MKPAGIRKILVIDDDKGAFLSINTAVEAAFRESLSIVHASNVKDGFGVYFSAVPDIVFLDIRFPGDDKAGMKLLRRIKSVPAAAFVPVVLLSDRDSINVELLGLDEKYFPDDFLAKPISERELIAKIGQWDRTLSAERTLALQNEALQVQAHGLAKKHMAAMQQLNDQHNVATLGLFTRGLIAMLSDILSSIRGYAALYDRTGTDENLQRRIADRLMEVITQNTGRPKLLLDAMNHYFVHDSDREGVENVIPILEALISLAKPELLKSNVQVVSSFVPVERCILVPANLISTVMSIFLFLRDAALPGSVVSVSSRQTGRLVELDFVCPVKRELTGTIEDFWRSHVSPENSDSSTSAAVYPLRVATDCARGMHGGIECTLRNGILTITLSLSTERILEDMS
ncbi:MAG: response regulator [Candidatus Brocadiia bacterium]